MTKRVSKADGFTDEEFTKIVYGSKSMQMIASKLGYYTGGRAYLTPVKNRCQEMGITLLHLDRPQVLTRSGFVNAPRSYILDDETFIEIVNSSFSIREILSKCGYNINSGSSYDNIKNRCQLLELQLTHFEKPFEYTKRGYVRSNKSRVLSDNQFSILVSKSVTYLDVANKLGYSASQPSVKRRIQLLQLSTAHFRFAPIELSDILNGNRQVKGSILKKLLIENNLKTNQCEVCGNYGVWQNKTLPLQLHHVNGDPQDNKLENLQILCPLCHSVTDNWQTKNWQKLAKVKISELTNDQFVSLLNCSSNMRDISNKTKWSHSVVVKAVQLRCKTMGLNIQDFINFESRKRESKSWKYYAVKNSTKQGTAMKLQLIKEGIMDYVCCICRNIGRWENLDTTLQLHHINGDNKDHRLNNLQILCLNCHTQTDNYCGKNIKGGS